MEKYKCKVERNMLLVKCLEIYVVSIKCEKEIINDNCLKKYVINEKCGKIGNFL